MADAIVTVQGGPPVPSASTTILGRGTVRLPTAGKIRAGIQVLTRKAAQDPNARAIYDQGVDDGLAFDAIARAISDAVPELDKPLVPRNVPWFTVRANDFANGELARQIMQAYGEDRGEGVHLYRFPVIFPSDHWQTVMPHELAAWGSSDKRYWSQYSPDGRDRHCMRYAPVPTDDTGRRTIRIFGGRKVVPREVNDGRCEPEACAEYQQRECNLTGRFVFYMPGVRAVSAFELPTNSFYAMNAAIRTFQAVAFLRGGRISGFLDRRQTPFFICKRHMEILRIDERGQAVRTPQWIIELEAPVDVAALLREHEDTETAILQADRAAHVLEGEDRPEPMTQMTQMAPAAPVTPVTPVTHAAAAAEARGSAQSTRRPELDQVIALAQSLGVLPERFLTYADARWGVGWRISVHGRARAWDELDRHRNDAEGYRDKLDVALRTAAERRAP